MAKKKAKKKSIKKTSTAKGSSKQAATPSASPPLAIPAGYPELLEELKGHIRQAQVKAALAANRELIALYWSIGQRIVQRQEQEGWGKSVIDRLAADLQAAFPGVSGFSPSNVWRMRSFYLAYTQEVTNLAQPVREMGDENLA